MNNNKNNNKPGQTANQEPGQQVATNNGTGPMEIVIANDSGKSGNQVAPLTQQQQQAAAAAVAVTNANNAQQETEERMSTSTSLESVTSFAQTRVHDHKRPNLAALKKEVVIEDHKLSLEQVCAKYDTHLSQGLSKELAKIRLTRNGPNELTPPKPISECYKFSNNLIHGFSLLLWAGAFLYLIAYCNDGRIQ